MAQMNLSTEKKQTNGHREQTCVCRGGGGGERGGERGSLRTKDANYSIWSG